MKEQQMHIHVAQNRKPQIASCRELRSSIGMVIVGGLLLVSVAVARPQAVSSSQNSQQMANADTDGDGLSDYHESHKYMTDPLVSDSDNDGLPDGDWLERREFQYTVRSVVQVMKPVTIDFLNDHYQDARVLDETSEFVELEVIHYPFNTIASTIGENNDWRQMDESLQPWIKPGPSSDWTPEMRDQMIGELQKDGIDVKQLSDRQVVEKVSTWLCKRAEYTDGFTTFVTAWDVAGTPFVPGGLNASAESDLSKRGLTIQQQLEREVSAAGMFKHKTRGSCTSSAIYLSGCLKALGIPTRTVLCIPLIDASDEREFDLVMNIKHPGVRQHLLGSLKPLKQSWASHTFNEVFVGGVWQRLNYNKLGQGIYDRELFGMITHVATFADWAEARAHETIGKRQKKDGPKDVFGFRNPYSTISLRDEIGAHCKVELPEVKTASGRVVERILWTDDSALPDAILESCRERGRFGLIAEVSNAGSKEEFLEFLEYADLRVFLDPPADSENSRLKVGFDKGCFWLNRNRAFIYIGFGPGDKRDLAKDAEYVFSPRDSSADKGWQMKNKLTTTRVGKLPK